MTISVLICDDQDIVREGLQLILESDDDISVIGTAMDGAQALEQVAAQPPDVVLMDLKMPGMNGIHATRAIHEQFPGVRVLVLTTYDGDEWVFDAIRGGASGYLLKDTPREGLIAAVKGTMQGQTHVDPAVAGKLFRQIAQGGAPNAESTLIDALSERERSILRLLTRGLTNAEIGAQLYLSEGTVRNYITSLFSKLGVTDRTQAAVLALRYGLAD